MAKCKHELNGVDNGWFLICQDILSSSHFRPDEINRMVAMGIGSQVGNTLVAVVDGQIQVIDGSLPDCLVRLVLDADHDRGFTCLEPHSRLVARYSYVPVTSV